MQLTQLNSVQPISAKQVSRVELSCAAIDTSSTQLNSTRRRVELSCVAINGPLRTVGWLRGTVVERRSLTGELSLSYARPLADG